MIKSIVHLVGFCFLLFISCIEPYTPEWNGEESLLVVDALVTDNPEYQYVLLSYSTGVDSQKFIPVDGAGIVVSDNFGNEISFYEADEGKYVPVNFTGIAGRSYKLAVTLANGKQYNSEYQLLTVKDEFDSVYYKIEIQPTTNPQYPVEGARFYIDIISSGRNDAYYLFQLEETYKFNIDFRLEYIEAGNGLVRVTEPPSMVCWKTTKLEGYYLYKSNSQTVGQSQSLPLHYVTFDTRRFSERYSLLIRQISVSEEIFNIYYQVSQQANGGSIFAIQPFNIIGNIKCVTDSEEPVLGSFVVGGIKEKREFFNKPPNVTFTYSRCFALTEGVEFYLMRGGTPEAPLYFTLVDGSLAYVAEQCFFCSGNGGIPDKPVFWED